MAQGAGKLKASGAKPGAALAVKKTIKKKSVPGNSKQQAVRRAVYTGFENKLIGMAGKNGSLRVVKQSDEKRVAHVLRTTTKDDFRALKKK